MTSPLSWLRRRVRGVLYRSVRAAAPRVGLYAYEPSHEHHENLDTLTEYTEDRRVVRDKRPTTRHGETPDLTITVEGLEDVLAGRELRGCRVLEVGPKYGIHSLWIDRVLAPAELVFSDFAQDAHRHEAWAGRLTSPHRFVYGDLRSAEELFVLEPFELVFFLGVLYHSAHHLALLEMLNRVTGTGGLMLLETTIDPRPDASVRLRWQASSRKAKAVPTVEAIRVMLAWTGWRRVSRFVDYRPGSSEALFLCEKTDDIATGDAFAGVVRPQRA